MIQRLKAAWKADAYLRWVFLGTLAYALIMSQGVPLWDDDFTSWFRGTSVNDKPLDQKGFFEILLHVILPFSTQAGTWGFNERPVEHLVYKIFYAISGYEAWSYFVFKSIVYASIAALIYKWGLRLAPAGLNGKKASLAAAIFAVLTPGPMAAFILHQDIAPLAAVFALASTYLIWKAVDDTPETWKGFASFKDSAQKAWIKRWLGIVAIVYLGYKTKADLKLIPLVFAGYVLVMRRKQLKLFAGPLGLMLLLAVPWGPGIFTKLPPFMPGSQGSQIGWMWQPASFGRLRDFLWSGGGYDIIGALRAPTISLAGVLGPYLLIPLVIFMLWRAGAFDKVPWRRTSEPSDRARIFALIWFGMVLVGVSALPEINYTFRIRYGILPIVPAGVLLAWVFGLFLEARPRVHKAVAVVGIAAFAIQSGINLNRSIAYRRDMGQVMVSVDQAYEKVAKDFAHEKLVLLPDFRPYDYRPGAGKAFDEKSWVQGNEDIKKFPPFKTYVISWSPSLWDQLEIVQQNTGCRDNVLFDKIFRCPAGTGAFLMRYIGSDPSFAAGEAARGRGDVAGARRELENFLAKFPKSMAGQFSMGLVAFQQKDWARAEQAYSMLSLYFPTHLAILYNHALALAELKQYRPAIERLKYIIEREPANYAALTNLYFTYKKDGQKKRAKELLASMRRAFPNDAEISRLMASEG